MSMTLMVQAMKTKVGNPLRKLVLIKLADNASDSGECWPSYKHIADQCEVAKSTVKAHIRKLADQGFLTIERRRKGDTNSSNLYRLHIERGQPESKAGSGGATDDLGREPTHPGATDDLGRSSDDLGGGATDDPRTSHSLEPVNEPANESPAPGDKPPPLEGELADDDEPRSRIPADMPGPKDPEAKTTKAWANYAVAYRKRYGEYPVWNKRIAGQLSQLVDRVGKDDAPAVAAYFLTVNDGFYVRKGHQVGQLLSDCETLVTQMRTGRQMTQGRARQIDRTESNRSSADETAEMIRAKYRSRQGA